MNPTRVRRSAVSFRSDIVLTVSPSTTTVPDVGLSSPARQCISDHGSTSKVRQLPAAVR